MGLDDLLPDGVDKSSSQSRTGGNSSGGSNTTSEEQQEEIAKVVTGVGEKKKRFTEELWEDVKAVIRDEYPYTVNEVLNNLPAQKRYKIVHEAALFNDDEKKKEELEDTSEQRCAYCGNDCSSGFVTLEGEDFCIEHTAGQVASTLKE